MKTSLFCLLMLSQIAMASIPDSIIVNTSKTSKVIFYGRTRDDLKRLEKLDLNQLLKKLNQQQETTNNDSLDVDIIKNGKNKKLKLDINLNQPANDIGLTNVVVPNRWLRFKKNTFLNGYLGIGLLNTANSYEGFRDLGSEFGTIVGYPGQVQGYANHTLRLQTKNIIGISVLHDFKMTETKSTLFAFRLGLGFELLSFRLDHSTGWGWSYQGGKVLTNEQMTQISEKATAYFLSQQIKANIFEARGNTFSIQAMQKIFIKNKNNIPTFSIAMGGRLNTNFMTPIPNYFIQPSIWSGAYRPIISTPKYEIVAREYPKASVSFIGEIGYKNIALFFNYNPDFTQMQKNVVLPNNGYIVSDQANIGFLNIGLKLGR
jgi:hypothetical protein